MAAALATDLERELERGCTDGSGAGREPEHAQEPAASRVMAEDAHESKIAYDARMRARSILVVAAALAAAIGGAACRTQPFDHPIGSSFDFAVPDGGGRGDGGGSFDLAQSPDLSRPGCNGIVESIAACSSDSSSHQFFPNG